VDSSSAQTFQAKKENLNLWPIRSISLLLILQALGLLLYNAYQIAQFDWLQEIYDVSPSVEFIYAGIIALIFGSISIILLFAALGFFYRRPVAWLIAMMMQGLILLACLIYYFLPDNQHSHTWVYPIMFYAVLMVLYINARDVRLIFQRRHRKPYIRPLTPPRYRGPSTGKI